MVLSRDSGIAAVLRRYLDASVETLRNLLRPGITLRRELAEARARLERLERRDEVRDTALRAAAGASVVLRQQIADLTAFCDRFPAAEVEDHRVRVERLERHDEMRDAALRAAADASVVLRQQIAELTSFCDRFPAAAVEDYRARVERLERHDEARATDLRAAGDNMVLLRQQLAALMAFCDRFSAERVEDHWARVERLERHDDMRATDLRAAGDNIVLLRQHIAELAAFCARVPADLVADQAARVERLEQHDEMRAKDLRAAGDNMVLLRQQIAELVAFCARIPADLVADQAARVERLEQHDEMGAIDLRAAGDNIVLLRQQLAELTAFCARVPADLFADQAERVARLERHDEMRATDHRAAGEDIVLLRQQLAELAALYDRLSSGLVPPDLAGMRRHIAGLVERGRAISDDLQERSLRLELRADPFSFELTYALVALLHRQGQAPLPEPPPPEADGAPEPASSGVAALLDAARRYAEDGDTIGHYACLWQIVMRYPQSGRGWAEYSKSLAERHEWAHCRTAAIRVLGFAGRPDRATAEAVLAALATLARQGQVGDLGWRAWLSTLPLGLRQHPQTASLLLACGEVDGGGIRLPSPARLKHATADDCIAVADLAWEREDWERAYWYWRRAFEADLPRTLRTAVIDYSYKLSWVLTQTGRADELADWLSVEGVNHAGANVIPPLPTPESARSTQEWRDRAIERGLPSIVLITQPKSASVTISALFNHGFGLVTAVYSLIDHRIVAPWLADYQRGGACYTTHLLPNARNIELLAQAGANPIIVNIRDPRQWAMSLIGHYQKYPQYLPPAIRGLGDRDGDRNAAISWVIRQECPRIIGWIDGWVGACSTLPIHFTTFEEFVGDRAAFVERCLSLYGGDRRYFDREMALTEQPGIDYHRRLGAVDEWRSVLTPDQAEAVNRMIPQRLWDKFGWRS